ncbi:MAG: hypothetical protein KBA72_12875 [Thermoanaerobaculia bacterium]|nr:hypothetical protein [Thermoanaerobaculia bacterium]
MATKKTSGKTAASTRAPRKKQDGTTAKTPAAATVAAAPAARPAKAAKSKPAENAAKSKQAAPAAKAKKVTKLVTASRQPNEATPAKSVETERVAAQIEAIPPQPVSPSRGEIAARAAAIWRETGGAPFDNWIRAERELGA